MSDAASERRELSSLSYLVKYLKRQVEMKDSIIKELRKHVNRIVSKPQDSSLLSSSAAERGCLLASIKGE